MSTCACVFKRLMCTIFKAPKNGALIDTSRQSNQGRPCMHCLLSSAHYQLSPAAPPHFGPVPPLSSAPPQVHKFTEFSSSWAPMFNCFSLIYILPSPPIGQFRPQVVPCRAVMWLAFEGKTIKFRADKEIGSSVFEATKGRKEIESFWPVLTSANRPTDGRTDTSGAIETMGALNLDNKRCSHEACCLPSSIGGGGCCP